MKNFQQKKTENVKLKIDNCSNIKNIYSVGEKIMFNRQMIDQAKYFQYMWEKSFTVQKLKKKQ